MKGYYSTPEMVPVTPNTPDYAGSVLKGVESGLKVYGLVSEVRDRKRRQAREDVTNAREDEKYNYEKTQRPQQEEMDKLKVQKYRTEVGKATREAEDEGVVDSYMFAMGGDYQNALKSYNSTGKDKIKDMYPHSDDPTLAVVVGMDDKQHVVDLPKALRSHAGLKQLQKDWDREAKRQDDFDLQAKKAEDDRKLQGLKGQQSLNEIDRKGLVYGYSPNPRSNRITPTQQSKNSEIDAARAAITGLDREDILARTRQYTATGRENPNFDPFLASQVKKALQRKTGDDADFEELYGQFYGGDQPQGLGLVPDARNQTRGYGLDSPDSGAPPMSGARQAPDGNWYVADPKRPGKFMRVE